MRTLAKGLAVVVAAVWTLLAWGGYAIVGWAGDLAARHADIVTGQPETVVALSGAASVLTSVGLAGVVVVWILGLLVILAVPAVVGMATRRLR